MTFEEWQKAHYIKCGFISSTTELRMAWDAAQAALRAELEARNQFEEQCG
jgi:hypothetical protein